MNKIQSSIVWKESFSYINLKSAAKYIILNIFLILNTTLFAQQIAKYDFEQNLNDASPNSFHLTKSFEEDPNYLPGLNGHAITLDTNKYVTAPIELTNALVDTSFSLKFNFKVNSLSELDISIKRKILFANKKNVSDAGIMVYIELRKGILKLVGKVRDGLGNEIHTGITNNLLIGTWNTLTIELNGNNKDYIKYKWEDSTGQNYEILRPLTIEPDFSLLELNKSVVNNNFYFGGSEEIAFNHVDYSLDNLEIHSPVFFELNEYQNAVSNIINHFNGNTPLPEADLSNNFELIKNQTSSISFSDIRSDLLNLSNTFDQYRDPVFINLNNRFEFDNLSTEKQIGFFTQQAILDYYYQSDFIQELEGVSFKADSIFPGEVSAAAQRVNSANVTVDATYNADPVIIQHSKEKVHEFVVRPLGYYAASGELITIKIDEENSNKGLSVVVGAHMKDLSDFDVSTNRLYRISKSFPLTNSETTVANPFGGGLYIKVPDGTNLGDINVTVENAIKSPYFSSRTGKETELNEWLNIMEEAPVPWVDFESDKFMATVPWKSVENLTNPGLMLDKWDIVMDQVAHFAGINLERERAEYYQIDSQIDRNVFSIGYPMTFAEKRNPWYADTHAGISTAISRIIDPEPYILGTIVHEYGHMHTMPAPRIYIDKFAAERENHVNVPIAMVHNVLFGKNMEDAFKESSYQRFSMDQAAWDWMLTTNFRNGHEMQYDTTHFGAFDIKGDELRYQSRGQAKYIEMASIYGWDLLNNINQKFREDLGTIHLDNVVERLDYILKASQQAEQDLRPLLHFWGFHPNDSVDSLLENYIPNLMIKNRLLHYFDIIPQNMTEYQAIYDLNLPAGHEYMYDSLLINFDNEVVNQMETQVKSILSKYYLPEAPFNFSFSLGEMDSLNFSWNDTSIYEEGFILGYNDPDNGNPVYIDTLEANVTSANIYLETYCNIDFFVAAYTDKGLSNSNLHNYGSQIPTPSSFQAVKVSDSRVDISWEDVNGEASYTLERAVNSIVNFSTLHTAQKNSTSFSDSTVTAGNSYLYRIKSVFDCSSSQYSNIDTVIIKATPTVTWSNPSNILTSTPLGQNQLNATASVHGSFTYTPTAGTILAAGTHTLSVDFVPADIVHYNAVNGTTVSITVDGVAVPQNFNATTISPDQINLSWDDVEINTGYIIERSTSAGAGFVAIAQREDNSVFYADNNLDANTTYYYRIKALYNLSSSEYSAVVSASTTTNAPENFAAQLISDNQIDLSWDDTNGETSYTIQRAVDDNNNFSDLADITANSITYSDNTTSGGNTYFYRIRANNDGGASAYSDEVSAQTSCGTPGATSVSAITDQSATFNWSAVSGANGYEIVYGQIGSGLNAIFADADDTSITVNGLFSGANYQWRIRTICTENQLFSDFSAFEYFSTTGAAACDVPSATFVSGITNNTATFNWTEPGGAVSYQIQYGVHGSNTLNLINVNAGATSVNLNGLFNGTDYQVRIRTVCTIGQLNSQWSDFIYFSTTGAAACNMPTGTSITGITDNSATFNWVEPAGAASYEIVYGVLGSGLNDITANVGTSSVNLTGLFSGTTYQVRIRTICTSGQLHSQYTTFIYFTTSGAEACSFPANLNTTGIAASQATANWDVVAGADSYHIVYGMVGGGLNDHYVAGGASVSSVITGLNASSNYRWRMRTICNTGSLQSGWSGWDYFTTSAAVMRMEGNARVKSFKSGIFNVFPNPSNGIVNISLDQLEEDKIQLLIYNTVGKLVFTSMHEQLLNQKVNLKQFGKGLYLIKVNSKSGNHFKRVIIK